MALWHRLRKKMCVFSEKLSHKICLPMGLAGRPTEYGILSSGAVS